MSAVALVVALASGILLPTRPASAASGRAIILFHIPEVENLRHDPIEVCVDEVDNVIVKVNSLYVYRLPSDSPDTRRSQRLHIIQPVRVIADVQDSQIAELGVSFRDATPEEPRVFFEVTGKKAGSTAIRVRDTQGQGLELEVHVIVRDCTYKVSATSTWKLDTGFQPYLYARISDIELRRTGSGTYEGTGLMQNRAVGHFDFCVVKYLVPPSAVHITGTIQRQPQGTILAIEIRYDEVSATPSINCGPAGASGSGTGKPWTLANQVPAWEFSPVRKIHPGHLLDAGRGGSPSTDTELVVTLVRQ